ncbi:hypothetical protein [Anaeromyxobacter oryzae]|uniref:Uncharacterized protein n=1 Tax=Anaeromyxobacter oryzae TaxID=2918170 RepID=A0ABM7X3S7_9BACT|nr:hypothetical protein [Anaeromyxobacter oryzae]BDG06451.1 hypothetical protein AMOR_54470 [Anaeromyxobacter oryzae]
MKEPVRPDPLAAAQRVKDLARDLARDLAQDVADGYRKSTRFFRLRAAVVGTWFCLSALTLWLACPSSGNALGAEVTVSFEDPLQTYVLVANTSADIWTDVILTLDGEWSYEKKTVRDGERIVVATAKFTRDGAAAAGDMKPKTLTIRCEQGKVTTRLATR